jgi:hypothetical protein
MVVTNAGLNQFEFIGNSFNGLSSRRGFLPSRELAG